MVGKRVLYDGRKRRKADSMSYTGMSETLCPKTSSLNHSEAL